MGDESAQAGVVSNSPSRESFVGLSGANNGVKEWEQQPYPNPSSVATMADTQNLEMNNNNNNQTNASQTSTPSLTPVPTSTYPSTLMMSKAPLPILPSAGLAVPAAPTNNTVPEFLYQLTKMLTGGHNDIIEWSNGRIEVHSPHKLENIVLQKYFRHSKFASFQRQLNYFGFRKLAGKGKMAPCSYVNEAASQDIGSLLLIKRKTTTTPKDKNGRKHAAEKVASKAVHVPISTAKGVVHQVRTTATPADTRPSLPTASVDSQSGNSQHAIAQAAVGRGIRHSIGFGSSATAAAAPDAQQSSASAAAHPSEQQREINRYYQPMGVQDSLSQLASNYQNSLVDLPSYPEPAYSGAQQQQDTSNSFGQDPFPSLLSRNSSLIDLAMIPTLEDGEDDAVPSIPGMNFVDFPQPEVDPSKFRSQQQSGQAMSEKPGGA